MRKVDLRMNEYEKYIKIKNLVETNGNKQLANKKSEISEIKSKQLSLEFAHPTQPRSKYFGEEIQIDGCLHRWDEVIEVNLTQDFLNFKKSWFNVHILQTSLIRFYKI